MIQYSVNFQMTEFDFANELESYQSGIHFDLEHVLKLQFEIIRIYDS